MPFENFLNKIGYEATSYIDQLLQRQVITINGETFLYVDIPKTKYGSLLRHYHFANRL